MMRPRKAASPIPTLYPWNGPMLVALLAAISFASLFGWTILLPLLSLALLSLVFATRAAEVFPAALLFFFLYIGRSFFPANWWLVPSTGFLIPLAMAGIFSWAWPRARHQWRWLQKGNIDLSAWLLVAATSFVSAVALLLWAFWTDNLGLGAATVKSLSGVPTWFLFVVAVPAFAVWNAFAEEAVFRGVILEALLKCFPGNIPLAQVMQASAFAAMHYLAGFPNGKLGYLMTFIYAWVLGYLRIRTNGILASFLAHVAADFVIGVVLLLLVH